jgi:hypothetical protein
MAQSFQRFAPLFCASTLALIGLAVPMLARAQVTAPGANSGPCDQRELISSALITGRGIEGVNRRVQDGVLALEGTTWNDSTAVTINAYARMIIDMHEARSLRYLALQGDNNDAYVIEGSLDGESYSPVWTTPTIEAQGLRTRWVTLDQPVVARYLRVHGAGGDGYYSISELRAYCAEPKPWPLQLVLPPVVTFMDMVRDPMVGWHWIDNDRMVMIKGWAAAAATVILLSMLLLPYAWRARGIALAIAGVAGAGATGYVGWRFGWIAAVSVALVFVIATLPILWRRGRIGLDISLALCGLFAFASWWNLLHFHFDHYEHIWEHYHYYMGAKYGPELRYSRLYECTATADMQDGLRSRVVKRNMRDLAHTNELGSTDAIVADPTRCTKHFTPARWVEFRSDIRFFRNRFSKERWDESQGDHGYNGTPVWGILGKVLTDYGGDLTWDKIRHIAWIDSALLVLMWVAVLISFGWRSTCVALLYWGHNFPARFYWNGGSMLRYDWLFWIVIGICCLRKKWHFAGGAALTYATLLRVFPGFIVVALILKALARMIRLRRLVISRGHMRFAMGALLMLAVAIPASSWATGGLDAWGEFAQNSKKHLATALTNNMGLKTALGFDYPTSAKHMRNNSLKDPFREWKEAREYYYHKRGPIMFGLLLMFCVMLGRAADREPDWAAACLGAGLIVLASELTCYYYGFLLTYGLLWERRKLPGILATALAAVTCMLSLIIDWNDEHFAAMSLGYCICIVLVTFQSAFLKAVPNDDADEPEPSPAPPAPTPRRTVGAPSLTSARVQDGG